MGYAVRVIVVGVLFCALCEDCLSLRDVKIDVPPAVIQGEKAVLKCSFNLEGDKLYSVKWYRGAGEFYRFTPSDTNPIKQFKIKGFHVVEAESTATQVVLEDVSRAISGPFSCEVTADQPSFYTDMKTADLEVVAPPQKDPYITGLKTRYRIGDILKANCTSEDSSPAASLAWYVNGHHIGRPHVHKFINTTHRHEDVDFATSYATLRLKLNEHHFPNGRLKIRCSANMHHIYHRSSEKSVELEKKKHKVTHSWYVTTTTTTTPTPEYPQVKWQYVDSNSPPPRTTLLFYSPINSHAESTHHVTALPWTLVPLCLLLLFQR